MSLLRNILLSLMLFYGCPFSSSSSSLFAMDLILGVEDIEYYPLYAKRENQYAGFAREFFDEYAKQFHHHITYKPMPVKRLYAEFLSGNVDLKFPDNTYWAQGLKAGKEIAYSEGIIEYIDGVLVLPKHIGRDRAQLKILGIVRGFTAWDFLSDINAGTLKVKENSDLKGLVNLAKVDRIDGVYFNVLVARHYLKHTLFEEGRLAFDESLPFTRDFYSVSSIKHPDIIREIDLFISKNGQFMQQLRDKYEINL